MKQSLIVTALLVLCGSALAEKARYDNYRIYKVSIETAEQLELLQMIERNPDGYQYWADTPQKIGQTVDMMVPPHKFGEFGDFTEKFALKAEKIINNLQELMDNEQPKRVGRAGEIDWKSYNTLADIEAWMQGQIQSHPGVVTSITAGQTYEGRDIKGVRISYKANAPAVVIEANLHAREWISGATATWIINEVINSNDPATRALVEQFDWHIIPISNPDGYVYSHTTDRNWRKNRRPMNAQCIGADPNRNWDSHFAEQGVSTNPCALNYPGPYAFSEPEPRSLSEYIAHVPRMTTYFSFHAYSQILLLPYGHTTAHLDNYDNAMAIGRKGLSALTAKFGTTYTIGNIGEAIYLASGGSIDWVKAYLKTPLSYCYEFRDTGRYGFSLPADQIIPNSQEAFASIVTILSEAFEYGYHNV